MHLLTNRASVAAPAALLFSFIWLLWLPDTASASVRTGDRAAEFISVQDERGRRVKLRQFRNKVVVLTFGASWCQPCKRELPAWEKVARKYKDRGVVFLAVNIDKELAKGKEFMKEARLKVMRALYEPAGSTAESYDPPTMPTTYIIDKHGVVRQMHTGFRAGDEKKLAAELDKLLAR